jgi:glycosyltransferase involved in cell wall biosynthesis
MAIWFDVEDLFEYAGSGFPPSGIQRLSYELYAAVRALNPAGVGFVRHDRLAGTMRVLDWSEVEAIYSGMLHARAPSASAAAPGQARRLSDVAGLRFLAARLPRKVAQPLGEAARAQLGALRSLWRAARAAYGTMSLPRPASASEAPSGAGGRLHADLREVAQAGDVLASFGSPWTFGGYSNTVGRITAATGTRFAMLVYDLIPVTRPEFCDRSLVELFNRFNMSCLPMADTMLAISEATARDIVAWSAREGVPLRSPPRPIPIGTGFSHSTPAPVLPPGLSAGGYALFVSTIEARKNHILAFRAWRRLLEELPADQVPTLVFAGRTGWMVADLMQQIQNTGHLGGKLVHVESPDDATLAALYQGARFTLFPSHYEGWGLPVSESLSFGKVCLAASTTSLPEAGGDFCLYHDPDSVTDAVALYRRAITEPALIQGLEGRIRAEYCPTPWSATARAVLDALG